MKTRKPLNRNLRIRLSEDEDERLLLLAGALGEKTRSRVVRKMIREGDCPRARPFER